MSMSDETGPCLVPEYSDVMMGTCRQNSASGTRVRARPPEDQGHLWVVQPVGYGGTPGITVGGYGSGPSEHARQNVGGYGYGVDF